MIAEPPTTTTITTVETPLIDRLELEWPPEEFYVEEFFDRKGRSCVLGKMSNLKFSSRNKRLLLQEVRCQAKKEVAVINDTEGRDAVLAALRNAEYALRQRGEL